MTPPGKIARGAFGGLRVLITAFALLSMVPLTTSTVSAAGEASITVSALLDDGATPLPFTRIQITDSNGTVYGPRETTPPDGTVTFIVDTVDDSTTFTVEVETAPACGLTPDPVEVGPLAEGETANVEFQIGFDEGCNLGSISIYSYSCPDGIDPSGTDYAIFRDNCFETIDGKSFTVSESSGPQQWNLITGSYGISGRAPLVGLLPGAYVVTDDEPVPDTETVVFCLAFAGTPGDAGDLPSVEQKDVDNNSIQVNLNGERVACDVFAVPSSGGDEPVEEPVDEPTEEPTELPVEEPTALPDDGDGEVAEGGEDAGTASLEVHLSACPAGYDGADLFGDCHDNGIIDRTITVEGPDGYFAQQLTSLPNDPGPGVAYFDGLFGGEYKVSEDIPGDTATYYAYCSMADSDQVVDFTYDDSTSEAIVLTLEAGAGVVCDFYIVPEDQGQPETGKLTITKYTCPVGYDSDAYGNLAEDCVDKTDGVTFTVAAQTSDFVGEAVSGDSGEGRVRFDLDPGVYDVEEDVPGDFSTPVVWCNLAGGDWYQKTIDGVGGTTFDVDAGDDIRCSWFNLPEDLRADSTLQIKKLICPPGQSSGFFEACFDDPLADTTFVANGPDGFEETQVTGENGIVRFENLGAGNYTITEFPPDGVNTSLYVVVCTRDGENYDFTYDDSSGLRINLRIPAGETIACDWYNVPPKPQEPGATGSVTVIKYLCQGRNDNKYNWDQDCESYGSGAEFELTTVSTGAVAAGITGSNGQLVFSGLKNGAYELDETSGDWCHAEADHVDANGNVIVQGGGNTNVYVYNCGKKQVNTLPSTGTGPAGWTLSASALARGRFGSWGPVSI